MKRMIGMVAAMALVTSTAAYAQNTQVEIHQYFTVANAAAFNAASGTGGLLTTPADWATNPSISATPGSSVYLAVWIRALAGDTGAAGTHIDSYNYEITGQGGSGMTAGGSRVRDLGSPYAPTAPAPLPGADYSDLPGVDSQMFGISGGNAGVGTIRSDSVGDAAGAFLIQIVKIDVAAGATGTLNLYMTTPLTSASKYGTGGVGSLTTVAFGATATGALDQKRASNATADIVGSVNNRVSSTPDAVITVVPEPGTLGLLALGLLGLRRRRS